MHQHVLEYGGGGGGVGVGERERERGRRQTHRQVVTYKLTLLLCISHSRGANAYLQSSS